MNLLTSYITGGSAPSNATASAPSADVKVQKTSADDSKDVKGGVPGAGLVIPAYSKAGLLRQSLSSRGVRISGQKGVTVRIIGASTTVGSTNTAYFPVVTVQPQGNQDWSSFVAVYDEWRCKRVTLHFAIVSSGAVATAGANFAVAWDPANPSAYSNISDVLTAWHHAGPYSCGPSAAGGALTYPAQFTKTGYHTLSSGELKAPVALSNGSSVMTSLVGGGWVASSDLNAIVGYFKAGVSPLGAGITATFTSYLEHVIEFRSRT